MKTKIVYAILLTMSAAAFAQGSPGTFNSGQGSINPSANQGQASQSGGSSANMAMGMALMAACMATQPPNIALCMMGAMALAQGSQDSEAADESSQTAAISKYGTPTATPTPASYENPYGTAAIKDGNVKAGLSALNAAGYKVTDKGVTLPDGSFKPSSSFANMSGFSAAGFSDQAVREAKKVLDKVSAEVGSNIKVSSVGVGDGGGGGGGAGGDSNSSNANGAAPPIYNPFAMSPDAKAKLVAGKTVMFDGEPIGVRGQNIFDMIHTAYQKRRGDNLFIESDVNRDVHVRSPASLRPFSAPKK